MSKTHNAGLKPVDLHVLLALRRGARHGYGLIEDLAEQSEGRLRIAPGSLYAALQRLLDWAWIVECSVSDKQSGGPPRRSYQLSRAGERVLAIELDRLRRLVALGDRRLEPSRGRT